MTMVSLHSKRTLTKTEVGTRSGIFDRPKHDACWGNVNLGTLN